MTRRKPAHDLDAFHTHLDALKLTFVREHYADVVRRAAEQQCDHLSVLERLIEGLCEAPSYVEFVPPIGDRRATLTIGTQHN